MLINPIPQNSAGNVWVKLFSAKGSGSNWAVTQLVSAHGQHSVKIPNIAAGQYLLRAEIVGEHSFGILRSQELTSIWLALHEGDVSYQSNPVRGAQLYMSEFQATTLDTH